MSLESRQSRTSLLTRMCLVGGLVAFGGAPVASQPLPSAPVPIAPAPAAPAPVAPTPAVPAGEPMWVSVDGRQTGPFDRAAITAKVTAGEIGVDTFVYTRSLGRWVKAGDVAELKPLFAGAPTPIPPPPTPTGDDRAADYIVGEWFSEGPTPNQIPGLGFEMQLRVQIVYRSDKSYRGYAQTIVAYPNMPPQIAETRPFEGRWSVKALNEREFMVTLTGSVNETRRFEILDHDRVRNPDTGAVSVRRH